MPDLKDRSKHEQRLTQQLVTLGDEWRAKIKTAAGDPPNIDRISASLWNAMEAAYKEKIAAAILLIYLLAFANNADDLELFGIADTASASLGGAFAAARAEVVSKGIVDNFRERLLAKTAAGKALEAGDIDESFGDGRASVIAVTETTAATSAGERGAVDAAGLGGKPSEPSEPQPPTQPGAPGEPQQPPAKLLEAVWFTEADSLVCPICRPLHGLPQSKWPQEILLLPDLGPPAHPNCRCWLNWRAVDNPANKGAA